MTNSNDFDAGAYWQERVGAGADLAVVGHRAMGPAYNGEIYARRIDALESMLARHVHKPSQQLRVLDIGCGSGFYTQFWQAKGVRNYVGVDISARTIEHLTELYPDYHFVRADISEPLADALNSVEPFDVITIFDVLYHIVDDQRVGTAIRNVGALTAADGRLLIMDQLCKHDYQVSRHVKYRSRESYLAMFRNSALTLADSELLFHYLVPPITGVRVADLLFAAVFKVFGLVLRVSDGLAAWSASKLRRLDERLRARGITVPNSELLVFASNSKRDV